MQVTAQNPEKSELRRQLRKSRGAIPRALRKHAGRELERLALRCHLLSRGRRIAFYVPAKGEIDCVPLLNRALWMGVDCYLPVVPHVRQKKLWFSRLGAGQRWAQNRFGIPEYGYRRCRVRAGVLDIAFIPLLGFDSRGYRIGMGGGYYDATMAFLAKRKYWRKPMLIGLGFEAQKLERLPQDPWDMPLTAVITERGIYRFNTGFGWRR